MVKISNEREFRAWINGQSNKLICGVAARIALRVVPTISEFVQAEPERISATFVLPMFRATALPWFSATWPNQGGETHRAATAAAHAAYAAANDAANARVARASSAAYATATHAAARAAYTTAAAYAPTVDGAARAAVHAAAYATTVDANWRQIEVDAEAVEAGMPIDELMRRPLWTDGTPTSVVLEWKDLKSAFLPLRQGWQVWTEWYDERLRGEDSSRPLIEELELKRVLIPDEDWERGPAHVNAVIAELEAEYREKLPQKPSAEFEVPPQRPAIIEVEYGEDSRLHRRPSPPPEARNEEQERRLRAAWAAHSEQLAAIEVLDPGRNMPALEQTLKSYRAALGTLYDGLNVIALGVHGASLAAFAQRADDILLEDPAGAIAGLSAAHGPFVLQFDVWREYLSDSRPEPSQEAVEAAAQIAQSTLNAEDIIDEDVSLPLNELAAAAARPLTANPDDRPPQIVKHEFIRSLGNIFSGWLTPLWDATKEGAHDGYKELIKKTVFVIGGMTGLAVLARLFPNEFAWIDPVLKALEKLFV